MNKITPQEITIFRNMSGADKLRLVAKFYWEARALKKAALMTFHPQWTEEQAERKTREIFLYGTG